MAVACGSYITLTATESGEMYSYGSNRIHFIGAPAWMRRRDTTEPMYNLNFGSEEVAVKSACGENRAVVTKQARCGHGAEWMELVTECLAFLAVLAVIILEIQLSWLAAVA